MRAQQKLLYFRHFFCGREDVYAFRVENKGYRPRRRPGYDLTDLMLAKHMQGRVMLGAYPIMLDGTTQWIAADFDGKNDNAFEESRMLSESLQNFGIETLCNTSQSGNGVHVRVIFDERVQSWVARSLMNAFLEMNEIRNISDGGAFDRLFPTQDELDPGDSRAIGNQIAMPFHMVAAEQRGGTMLLDNDFETIPFGDATWDALELYDRVGAGDIHSALCDIGQEYLLSLGSEREQRERERRRQRRSQPQSSGSHGGTSKREGKWQPSAQDLYYVVNNCDFMIYASRGGLNYDEWFVLATILTRYDGHGGREFFHRISSVDGERYDATQADKKYDNILSRMSAPVTCSKLAHYGFRCPKMGSDGVCDKFRNGWGRGPRTPATIPVFVENAA